MHDDDTKTTAGIPAGACSDGAPPDNDDMASDPSDDDDQISDLTLMLMVWEDDGGSCG